MRKAEFPQASIILIINEKARKDLALCSRSKKPNKIEVTPTVPIPKFSVNFIPMRFMFAPEIKIETCKFTILLIKNNFCIKIYS